MYYFHPCGREIGFFKFAFPFRVWRVWACVLCDSRCSQLVSMDRGGCLGEGGKFVSKADECETFWTKQSRREELLRDLQI